jgi:outer membrane protein
MKKIISITLLLGLTVISSVNAQKLGHIALDSLLKSMPESDSAKKVGQAYYMQLANQIESMQKELQQKYEDYQQKQAGYTELIKQTKQQELNEMNQRIQSFQGQAQTSLQRFNDSITRPVIAKAKNAINAVAKEHGYKYIFDTSSGVVLYSEDSDDVYGMVAEKLGIKPKATAKSK